MNKNKKKIKFNKLFLIRLVTLASSLVFLSGLIASLCISKDIHEPGFTKYNGYYDGSQVQISTTGSASSIETITMTDASNANSNNNKVITISSSAELGLFSTKCNANTAFLGYEYKLIANIEWDDSNAFAPIGNSTNAFSGTFDGQGYEIEGLLLSLNNTSYSGGYYYSMFNYLSGTVTNLGLSHPKITVTAAPTSFENGGVSYLVGENSGTLSNSFVIDDGDPFKEQAGIAASYANARVSDLVVINAGTISNCYVVTSRVYNIKNNESISQYNPITLSNSGSITNTYFYDESISTLTPKSNNKAEIKYKSAYLMTDKTNDYFGSYVSSVNNLITTLDDSDWYTKNDYGAYKDYTGIKYAVRRGISLTGSVFKIDDEKDFAYMYELFNADDKFASNELTYNITANLNLAKIPASSYTYKKGIGATIKGSNISGTPIMANGVQSAYPTIYNADVMNKKRVAKSTGVDCYGLFNYLTGTVENLNIVPLAMDFQSVDTGTAQEVNTNAKGIGALSGYIEGGNVKNVNIYANITNANSKNIGEYYVGGITGILGGNGKITGATSAGSINLISATTTLQASSSYMGGVAIGGIVGYIESSNGAVYTCLNAMDITSKLGESITYAIGGVIGAGYTMNYDKTVVDGITTSTLHTGKLENVGTITVGDSTYHTYSELYVSGIIARHTGELDEVSEFTNNGDISVYANGNTTYVSGVENADIISTAINNTKVEASQFKDSAGNTLFYASSLSNGASVTVTGSSTKLQYTNVLNIKAGNNVKSKVSDLYNLAYGYKYTGSDSKTITKLNAQEISMNLFTSFSPVLNVIGGTSQYTTKLTTAYNLRDITFNLSSAISAATTYNFTGCVLGEFINYEDIKNEGNINVNLAAGVSTASTLKVSGLFETLSNGCKAKNLYNGGNVTLNDSASINKNLTIYASGICYQNLSIDTSEEQNPLNASFDSSLVGTVDSVINNGNISFESSYISTTTKFNNAQTSYFTGNLYLSGIIYKNSGIISNTFNLGNLYSGVIANADKYFSLAGISNVNSGDYAQIRDSANNGEIKNINISTVNAYIRSSGISVTNDSEKQVLAFVINYGSIYSFTNHTKEQRNATEQGTMCSQASGILSVGLCNIVNVVNYGNIYANENAGGMIAKLDLSLYINPTSIKIANTLNYANIKAIQNYYTSAGSPVYGSYQEMKELTDADAKYLVRGYIVNYQYNGALIGIANYNNSNIINIRYLINFTEGISVVSSEYNTTGLNTDVSKSFNVESDATINSIMNGTATYAPLSAEIVEGNIGVFNKQFVFRRAISGDTDVIVSNQITDRYLSNFFQFIPFDKVSDSIIEKIGWKSIAYQAAAEEFMTNLDKVVTLINKVSGATGTYSDLVEEATTTSTWLNSCNTEIIKDLFKESLEANQLTNAEIKSVIDYILFVADSRTGISTAYRNQLMNTVINYIDSDGNYTYYDVLNLILGDELLAKIVSGANSDYASIQTAIQNIINTKSESQLKEIVDDYLEVLESNPEVLDPLFTTYSSEYFESKINVLTALLNGFTEDELLHILSIIDQTVDTSAIKYYSFLLENEQVARNIYSNIIVQNYNQTSSTFFNAFDAALKKYNVSLMLENKSVDSSNTNYDSSLANSYNTALNSISNANYAASNAADYTSSATNVTSLTGYNPTKDYVGLWNEIKNNSSIRTYLESILPEVTSVDSATGKGIYAVATEYNNTYQTLDGPSNTSNGMTMSTTGLVRATDANTIIRTRFIYTPDDVVSYGTHYYGPYKTASNSLFTTATQNRYLDLDDTGTASTIQKKYIPVYISVDRDSLYNKISKTSNPTIYEFVWNDYKGSGGGDSHSQWVSKLILDKQPGDSRDILFKNYASGSTYTYGGETVTTSYIRYGYDFNPDLVDYINYTNDRAVSQTIPGGTYTYTNLYTGQTITTAYADTTKNLINNSDNHTYRNHYITGYVSASLITGVYYHHSIWYENGIQGVFMTSKSNENVDGYTGVQTTAFINYFIDDLINLDGVRTKGTCNGIVSWDESNIINSLMAKIMSTSEGKDIVLHALAEKSVTGLKSNSGMMLLLNTIDLASLDFPYSSILNVVSSVNTSLISCTLNSSTSLKQYLDFLIENQNYSVLNRVIQIGTVDRDSFIAILNEANNYSYYSELYVDYLVSKSSVNTLVYNYVKDWKTGASDSDISDLISAVGDTDLTKINDLFSSSEVTRINISEYAYSDTFTIYNSVLVNSNDPNFNSYSTYTRELVGTNNNSKVSFETGNYEFGYQLKVIYKGTASIGEDSNTNANVGEYTFENLSGSETYDLEFTEGTEIYKIELLSNGGSAYYDVPTYMDTSSSSPFATVTGFQGVQHLVTGDDKYRAYGTSYITPYDKNNTTINTTAKVNVRIEQNNITYNSIVINFKLLYREGTFLFSSWPSLTESFYFNNTSVNMTKTAASTSSVSITESGTAQTYYIYQISVSVPSNLINTDTYNDFYYQAVISDGNGRFVITDMVITYNFDIANSGEDLSNKTNCVFEQNVFNSYYDPRSGTISNSVYNKSAYNNTFRQKRFSTITITNSNLECGVDITSNTIGDFYLTFDDDSPYTFKSTSYTSSIDEAIIFEPWYYATYTHTVGQIVDELVNFNNISMLSIDLVGQKFNNDYLLLSDVAKYLLNSAIALSPSTSQIVVDSESFVFVKAKSTVDVTETTTQTTYNEATVDAGTFESLKSTLYVIDNFSYVLLDANATFDPNETYYTQEQHVVYVNSANIEINNTSKDLTNDYEYYAFDLPAGTYTIYGSNFDIDSIYIMSKTKTVSVSSNAGIDTITLTSGANSTVLFTGDYSSIASFDIDTLVTSTLEGKTKFETFVTVYPYGYVDNTKIVEYRLAALKLIVGKLYPSMVSSNLWFAFDYSTYDVFTAKNVKDFIVSISTVDYEGQNSAFSKLIALVSTHYQDILKFIVGYNVATQTSSQQNSMIDSLVKILEIANTKTYNTILNYYEAAYVGNNFISKSNLAQLKSTIVYTLLSNYSSGTYNFIVSDSTVNGETFKNLLVHLGYSVSSDNIYGIYALSSSEGIGNGIFIPDNLTLSGMDNYYSYDNSNSVIAISNSKDAYWRGGETISSGYEGSVDYAFYHDMKQIVLSISTNVFELNINTSIKSVDDQIDNNNHIITYYVDYATYNSVKNAGSLSISSSKLANGATLSTSSISMSGAIVDNTNNTITINNAVNVIAEDTSVISPLKLIFVAVAPNVSTFTANPTSVGYNGGTVTFTLTGTDLPNSMDLEPYISIVVDGRTYSSEDGYWKFDPSYDNNCIVNNGSASIRIIIDKSLPGGTNAVEVNASIVGANPSVKTCKITKVQNTEKQITSFGFVQFGAANQEYNSSVPTSITSTIPYGRAYNYSDLTDPTSENFYLYQFSVSDNSVVVINATKSVQSTGLMQYVVTYSVTAEAGGDANVYTHTLTESTYFADSSAYATLYADGEQVTSISTEAYKALDSSQKYKYLYEGSLTYTLAEDTYVGATYDSSKTYYKISYSTASVTEQTFTTDGSLYTLSNGVYNKVTSGTYSSTTTYYKRNYETKSVTSLNYKTDGSLYKLVDGVYTQVFTGAFESGTTYYGLQYETASVTSLTFTNNGSLYTRSGEGTNESPYVYTQVIDRRSLEDDMFASVAFNRTDAQGNSIKPQYRIKYSLSNFYTIGDNVVFGTTDSTRGNQATTNISYAGLTVTVSENNDTGTYVFIYTYTNTGLWIDNEVYTRYYEFPEFIVEKQASTDALLHKLTFLEESIVLGNTATVILPTTPLVPDKTGQHYDNTELIYKDVFESTTRQIVVSSTGVKYNYDTDATSITDYYAIGTVSDADLSYYCPGFEVNEYAQIYQYTTLKKLTSYGIGVQTESDSEVLSVHDNMYLYVPYEKTVAGNKEISIFLVEVDSSGYWGNVYTTDYAGSEYIQLTSGTYDPNATYYTRSVAGTDGDSYVYTVTAMTAQQYATNLQNGTVYVSCKLHTYTALTVNAKNAKTQGDFGDYHVSEVAGEEDKNSSLYMDYVGTPLEGHFWYVSYVVFSEDYLSGGNSKGNVRYYHISIVDATNNVQFEVTIYADNTFTSEDIYLTISENTYKNSNGTNTVTGKRQISAYADDTNENYTGSRTDIDGYKIYELKYKLQTLPGGFFYFYVDLPDGYVAEARTDKANKLSASDAQTQPGAFDPQTSIITVKIQLEIIIKKGTNEDSNVWAVNTADIYTRQATYKGQIQA